MANLTFRDLTADQLKELSRGINRTWNVIAADVTVRSLAEQVEVTLDADYLSTYGGLSEDLLALFDLLSYEDQDKVAYRTFSPRGNY